MTSTPSGDVPRIAVVVPTRDRPDRLAGCLAALRNAVGPDDDVVVVDSASADPAAVRAVVEEAARTWSAAPTSRGAGLRLVRAELAGASRARNLGWRSVDADVVCFTDDDCRPRPGWTDAYRDSFAEDVGVTFAFGTVEADGADGTPVSLLAPAPPATITAASPPDQLGHGANMAVRRDVLETIGGFDEILGAGAPLRAAEDKDVFYRVLRSGRTGRRVPGAVVGHLPRVDRRTAVAAAFGYGVGEGALTHKRRRLQDAASDDPAGVALSALRHDLAARYWTGALSGVARLAGNLAGRRRARTWQLVDGRFCAPRQVTPSHRPGRSPHGGTTN